MSLRFSFEWVPSSARERPEIAATFASFLIDVDQHVVTEAFDKRSKTVRTQILVPLYPLAEWITANWWTLLAESYAPGREEYAERHSLIRARDGYSYPDLRLVPQGESVRIEWHSRRTEHQPVDFIADGWCSAKLQSVQQSLTDFVQAVAQRLAEVGITGSWLQEEWSGICSSLQSPEERDFCRAVAKLGSDPYDIGEDLAAEVLAVMHLPLHLRDEILRVVTPATLASTIHWLRERLACSRDHGATRNSGRLSRGQDASPFTGQPWEEGYALANEARARLNLGDTIPVPIGDTVETQTVVAESMPFNLDALVFYENGPLCHTIRQRPASLRFLYARSLLGYLFSNDSSSVLTAGHTEYQQKTRAFAAELLAPHVHVARRVRGRTVTLGEIVEIAYEFDVSPYVIEHQITNHRLAAVTREDHCDAAGRFFV